MESEYFLKEQVIDNYKKRISYSLPDIIKSRTDVNALVDVIDSNSELKLMAIADISDPVYKDSTAEDMWDILDKTGIGMKLLHIYPSIRKFKICSTLTNQKEDLYKYDVYENKKMNSKVEVRIPSFKEYVSNPNVFNPHEVSGVSFKS